MVFASGYGEVGTDQGRANEKELMDTAKELGIAVMGPNCAGFVNYVDNVQAFAFISDKRDRKGSVGVVSQSGQLCLSLMDCPGMRFFLQHISRKRKDRPDGRLYGLPCRR